ncbi:MAG: V-type ATPase subunit [Phycisphaerae bacterium]
MVLRIALDLDYLAANVHGRRSRLAEAERLDALCRLRSLSDLARHVFPEERFLSVVEFQRRLVVDLVRELASLAAHIGGASADLLDWLCVRFQMENLKVLARGLAQRMGVEDLQSYLVPLPENLVLPVEALATAESLEAFEALVPQKALRVGIGRAAPLYQEQPRAFFIEAGLDCGYLAELLRRAGGLPQADRDDVLGIARHETDTFLLMLASRGKFHYGLGAAMLLPFHVPHARIDRSRFEKMLAAEDLAQLAALAKGTAIDRLPARAPAPEAADLEAMAWDRHYRVANRCFRRSHMGLGAVVAYAAIRRIELANLIALSEGIRAGLDAGAIRRRLIPRRQGDPGRV